MSGSTVVIAAGGTGGHIYPAIAVANELESRHVPVVWIGTREGLESRIVPEANIDIRYINVSGLRGKGVLGTLLGPFRVLRASIQSLRILSDVKASAVLGMGGFVSGPVGIAALLSRRMLVLHEQNAIAGMTNKWLARLASRVYSAMPNVFPDTVGAVTVGNPVRESIEAVGLRKQVRADAVEHAEASEHSDTASQSERGDALRVLIIGGSRGARVLNETVPEAVSHYVEHTSAMPISVWHQTGANDASSVQLKYDDLFASHKQGSTPSINVCAYIDDVSAAYAWADVIICRAGAMTVSELSAAALPGILVPFPHHVDDHQTRNARFLSDAGAAILMPQQSMTAESLSEQLLALAKSPTRLTKMSTAARTLHKRAAASVIADALQGEQR